MKNKLLANEQAFRGANERLAAATAQLAPGELPAELTLELYCECANKACQERISITYGEYRAIAQGGGQFAVRPSHYIPEYETVTSRHPEYWVIAKRVEKLSKPFEL